MTKPIPDGFHTATPSLVVKNSDEAIEFYKKAFDAKEIYRFPAPDGRIMHAMIQIGDSLIMMSDEYPEMGSTAPSTIGGTATSLYMYVEDADQTYNKAVEAGAKIVTPIMDAFWGDRIGTLLDPFGHMWSVATHKIDMTPEGLRKAGEEYFAKMAQKLS